MKADNIVKVNVGRPTYVHLPGHKQAVIAAALDGLNRKEVAARCNLSMKVVSNILGNHGIRKVFVTKEESDHLKARRDLQRRSAA